MGYADANDAKVAPLLASNFMAGFECSSHRRRDGRRLDLIAATGHDRSAEQDFRRLSALGIRSMRDGLRWHLIEPEAGRYDWSSALPMLLAAQRAGVQVVWDLLHYGWPDWIDPWSADFIARFADFAGRAARLIGPGGCYTPINEISFLSWGGGEVGYLNPFDIGRGDALKLILCRAAIAATERIRSADARATIFTAEPLIHVVPTGPEPEQIERAAGYVAAQHDAIEILLGRRLPEFGGSAAMVDVVGLNYYPQNQFTADRETVLRDDNRHLAMRELLVAAGARLQLPMIVAETGCESDARPEWLAYVAGEVRAANLRGADVRGICLYPILNHPGWDDDRYCPNGLLCGLSSERTLYAPLADELARQAALGLGERSSRQVVELDFAG